MKINQDAPVKSSRTVIIDAAPEKVWEVLTDINKWVDWHYDVIESHIKGKLKPGTSFKWMIENTKLHSTLHTVETYEHFGWTGKTFGVFAIHNWTLTEINGKTEVLVEESMDGFITKYFKKRMLSTLEKSMETWLKLLKKEAEK